MSREQPVEPNFELDTLIVRDRMPDDGDQGFEFPLRQGCPFRNPASVIQESVNVCFGDVHRVRFVVACVPLAVRRVVNI